jgi:peptidase E
MEAWHRPSRPWLKLATSSSQLIQWIADAQFLVNQQFVPQNSPCLTSVQWFPIIACAVRTGRHAAQRVQQSTHEGMAVAKKPGIITLMGSGELTTSMVTLHKELLGRYGGSGQALFLDTPAGFQLNVAQISAKAADYFRQRVGHPLAIGALPSAGADQGAAAEVCYGQLQSADYILIGPGSPTYALRQWQQTRVPELLVQRIQAGACLVAASAAALTVGRRTLPVYEIYKVGLDPYWADGLDLLGAFGFDGVVIPHWNNAEGGNHDTRFCFMGAPRLRALEAQLPASSTIIGLDEHTALVIDLATEQATVRGMGRVTLRRNGAERVLGKGDPIPLALLRGSFDPNSGHSQGIPPSVGMETMALPEPLEEDSVWPPVEALSEKVQDLLDADRIGTATQALLALEQHIERHYDQLQERNALSAAREMLRNALALFGARLAERPPSRVAVLEPLVAALLWLRDALRAQKEWSAADGVRDCLQRGGVIVEDTPQGARWHLESEPCDKEIRR